MNNDTKQKLEDAYRPDEQVMEEIFDVYAKFAKWRALREQPYRQLNHATLTSWLEESRQKFWGYLPLSSDIDTPQFFFPETRNQIIQVLAAIAALKAKPSFEGVENFDLVKATVLRDLFESWRRRSNRKVDNFWQYLYNIVNGTVIVFTGYEQDVREVKNITLYDAQTGEASYDTRTLDRSEVREQIVYLEDFYFPKMWEPDIRKQKRCIWRKLYDFDEFVRDYADNPYVGYVMPGCRFSDQSIFYDFFSPQLQSSNMVEVIRYFDELRDQYMVIANGVLLNPIRKDGRMEVCPLPWNHKSLPFSKTIFEPIDPTFFYGMPLAHKVKSPQDALNRMWELMLDREQRAVAAPIITNDPAVETGLEFKAGRVYQVQADPQSSYREIQMAPTSGSFWNALTSLNGLIQRTGSGGSTGIVPSRQPVSARESMNDAQQREDMTGIYHIFYQDLLEQKAWLTIKNMIQFYTKADTAKAIGDRKFLKVLTLTDTMLQGGGIGNRELRITDKPLGAAELKKESILRSLMRKERVEIIEATPQALQDLEFDVSIRFEKENSPETERALFLDYMSSVMRMFGPLGIISPKKAFFRMSEKFSENPADLVDDNVLLEYEKERFFGGGSSKVDPGSVPQPSEMPGVSRYNNSLRGTVNGAQGPMQGMVPEGMLG